MGLAAWMCRPTRFTSPSISSGVLRREEVMSLQYGGWRGQQQRDTVSTTQQEPGHQHEWGREERQQHQAAAPSSSSMQQMHCPRLQVVPH